MGEETDANEPNLEITNPLLDNNEVEGDKVVETPTEPVTKNEEVKGVNITAEEYSRLLSDANSYKVIKEDSNLSDYVINYFRGKGGDTKETVTPQPQQQQQNDADEKINKLYEAIQLMDMRYQIDNFRRDNPDMDTYKERMGSLINQYNIPLEEAYKIAKAEAVAVGKADSVGRNIPGPTTEISNGIINVSETRDIDKVLMDRKKVRSISDAADIAIAEAKRVHGIS